MTTHNKNHLIEHLTMSTKYFMKTCNNLRDDNMELREVVHEQSKLIEMLQMSTRELKMHLRALKKKVDTV